MSTDSLLASSSVHKACLIMRVLSDQHISRLTDIASAAGLDKATTLRLLGTLAKAGFVVRDAASKKYSIGRELMVLGASALARFDPRNVVRPSLLRLTEKFQDTALFTIQSGSDSLCIDVMHGRYPIQVRNMEVGTRRPLGVGPTGLAMLACLREHERLVVLDNVHRKLRRYPNLSRARLAEAIGKTQDRGYAILLDAVVERMGAIAMAVQTSDGRLLGAIGLTALSDRITSREASIVEVLRDETKKCAALWSAEAHAGAALTGLA